jgi:serine/threonine-protein kinase
MHASSRTPTDGETDSLVPRSIAGRYAVFHPIDAGGMATVHFGMSSGAIGFARPVAIKRLHSRLSADVGARSMFVDEARLAARIHHPNVVQTLDVVEDGAELLLVMEYVHGESLARLAKLVKEGPAEPMPIPIALAVMIDVLHGLHAAHEAVGDDGLPLKIIHRDVSPQNILVGVDGVARLFDFGVAKAEGRVHTTENGAVKGKLAYMAPEQLRGEELERRVDVFAAGIVLWELLTGRRLFQGPADGGVVLLDKILNGDIDPPSRHVPSVDPALDSIVARALNRDASARFPTAHEMAGALEKLGRHATSTNVAHWVDTRAAATLESRSALIASIERASSRRLATPPSPASNSSPSAVKVPRSGATPLTSARTVVDPPPAPSDSSRTWLAIAAGVFAASLVTAVIVTTPTEGTAPELPAAAAAEAPAEVTPDSGLRGVVVQPGPVPTP